MKAFHTFQKGSITINGEVKPCLLFVTTELTEMPETNRKGYKITVSGKRNPFPFKEATITCLRIDLVKWLKDNGWEEIAREYKN